jgi:hypothetical protein
VPVGLLSRLADSDRLACTPSGCVFVTSSAREGVLPRMLREVLHSNFQATCILSVVQVLATRVECKRLMSAAKRGGMTQLAGPRFTLALTSLLCDDGCSNVERSAIRTEALGECYVWVHCCIVQREDAVC